MQKRCSFKFRKIHKKTPALKTHFWWSCRSTEFNFIEKEIPAQMFCFEFCEIFHNIIYKERAASVEALVLFTAPHDCSPFQKQCHTYFLAEYFFSLIYWLGKEWAQYFKPLARSLFSTQSNVWNGTFFAKIVNSLKPLRVFAKNALL